MFYAEFVKQATDLAGATNVASTSMDATTTQKAFALLQTSLLALNTDDRLTFAVDDISLALSKQILVFAPRKNETEISIAPDEQAYYTDYPVEIPPAYVILEGRAKMQQAAYENFISDYLGDMGVYAFRLGYGRAALHFRSAGTLKIGLKRPLDIPATITDEVRLTGTALNLLKYKLAAELMALYAMPPNPLVDREYSEYMQMHMKVKTEILPPPYLNAGVRQRRL
jgi:hypothetical protein